MYPTLVGVCRLSLVRRLLSICIFFSVGWIGGGRATIRQGHQHYISANYDRAKQDFEAAWDQEPSLSNFEIEMILNDTHQRSVYRIHNLSN